jgi:hypothetical protein
MAEQRTPEQWAIEAAKVLAVEASPATARRVQILAACLHTTCRQAAALPGSATCRVTPRQACGPPFMSLGQDSGRLVGVVRPADPPGWKEGSLVKEEGSTSTI